MKKTFYILSIVSIFYLSACEDVVQVDLGNESQSYIAIDAKITTAQNPYVYIYRSIAVDQDTVFTGISGAVVTISDDNQPPRSTQLFETKYKSGYYTVPYFNTFLADTGRLYTVNIEYDGETITASDFLYPVPPIDSIIIKPSLIGTNRYFGIYIFGDDPSNQRNYYKWEIFVNDTLLSGRQFIIIKNDDLVDARSLDNIEIYTDYYDERLIEYPDTVYITQNSISSYGYNVYYQLVAQTLSGGLFSLPAENIVSNFSSSSGNTILGMFTAQDVSRSNTIIISEEMESLIDN